jgi:HAD superfamily phosphoserine phosphatase-like hydrolase
MKKKIAVFDFDGTLAHGYISMKFLDYLYERKLYLKKSYEDQMKALDGYKNKKISYDKWCELWAIYWAEGLNKQKEIEVKKQAIGFFKNFKKNIYPASFEIINLLKKSKYKTICLSIGAYEVINLGAKELGMHETYSTKCEVQNGIYTGKLSTDLHLPGGKERLLKELLKKYDKRKSLGFGDSHSDIGFINLLNLKIALNPNEKLKEYAENNKWLVFNLDKDHEKIIGELKKII